jgi:hypothetical protein
MRGPCAGDALDPPLWKIPNKALRVSISLSLSLYLSLLEAAAEQGACGPGRRLAVTVTVTSILYII